MRLPTLTLAQIPLGESHRNLSRSYAVLNSKRNRNSPVVPIAPACGARDLADQDATVVDATDAARGIIQCQRAMRVEPFG